MCCSWHFVRESANRAPGVGVSAPTNWYPQYYQNPMLCTPARPLSIMEPGLRGTFLGQRFLGKVAVIIGGNSGIGLASARAFANEGARVVITGRDSDTLRAAAREVG